MFTIKANGAEIPVLGLGTWRLRGDSCTSLVSEALRLGYRHLDTAQSYENEQDVGLGLKRSGVPRSEVFLTTKIPSSRFRKGELQSAVEESIAALGTEPDLVLLHWPTPDVPLKETLEALADARSRGLTRHIGLSNFTIPLIEEAVRLSPAPIITNQVEHHLFLDQSRLLEACRKHGIALTAYSPIAKGRLGDPPVLRAIAAAHGKTAAQVALRWLVQREVIAIPRSSRPERLAENLAVFDFTLSDDEIQALSGLARADGRLTDPNWAPDWD